MLKLPNKCILNVMFCITRYSNYFVQLYNMHTNAQEQTQIHKHPNKYTHTQFLKCGTEGVFKRSQSGRAYKRYESWG